jgi:hypothetical protein
MLLKPNIIGYFRYADDVILIFNKEFTEINLTLQEFNNINPKLLFIIDREQNNTNFLEITK